VTDCCAEECQNCYEIVTEFSQELFFAMIEKITVSSDRILTFTFKNGIEIKV
jgi:hypothetical protein